MADLRQRLIALRPGAKAYAASLTQAPALTTLEARVGEVVVYPIKGMGGLRVERARVEREGLVDVATGLRDRGVMFAAMGAGTTAEGEAHDAHYLSNRVEAAFALTRARMDGRELVLEAPGVEPLRIDPAALLPREGKRVRVRLYDGGGVVEGVADDGPLAAWARALMRAHPRARRFAAEDVVAVLPTATSSRRVADKHRGGEDVSVRFGDSANLLVASSSTLAWMNAALAGEGARAIDMEVFRPNVVLEGLPPNVEDVIGEIAVAGVTGEVPIVFASMCIRCDATRVDIRTGEKPDREPLAFLARERPPRPGADGNTATFAMNAAPRAAAWGRVVGAGDRVRVLAERE